MRQPVVDIGAIKAAAARLAPVARRTPLIEAGALGEALGGRVFVKAETLQLGGAFKFRGAYNALAALDPETRKRGVVAFSSGNHAQGVALAARLFGVPALIVMPADAPRVKRDATAALGAEIRLYDRARENRETIATTLAAERGATLIPSFDHPEVIAGQGTVGLEIVQQARAAGFVPDLVMTPVGGGGLMAGVATAVRAQAPDCRLIGVEPAGFDGAARSLTAGHRLAVPPGGQSICDALQSPAPGELTWPVLVANRVSVETVVDAEVVRAMRLAFDPLKLVVEPGGAAALAALLAGRPRLDGRTAVVVLSGGNVDPRLFAQAITAA